MRYHRTLIATALTVGTLAGAITLSDPGRPATTAEPSTTAPVVTSPSSSGEAPPTIDPTVQPTVQPTVRPTVQPPVRSGDPSGSSVSTTKVPEPSPGAPAVVDVPDGAVRLDIDLAPIDSDSLIATGPEAIGWLEEASPGVGRAVADNVGTQPEDLTSLFLDDPTAFLSTDGMVGYVDPAPAPASSATLVEALGATPADVFALHSLPSSTKVIYLDFDGHQMQDEAWNTWFAIGPFTNAPYDTDGDSTTFSATERDRIFEIFQRVADDYAPFDIDVTTQDPGSTACAARHPPTRRTGHAW